MLIVGLNCISVLNQNIFVTLVPAIMYSLVEYSLKLKMMCIFDRGSLFFFITLIMLFVLNIVDLILVGNLVLMIIFAGYENFVSKLHVADESEDKPIWMGRVDFSEMKLKLVASIVTISGINLLAAFMDLSQISDREIFWMIIVHVVFILSGVLLALMDYVTSKSKVY